MVTSSKASINNSLDSLTGSTAVIKSAFYFDHLAAPLAAIPITPLYRDINLTNNADNYTMSDSTRVSHVLHALAGDDVVGGSSIGDVIYGDDGNDFIYGFNGNDTIYGGNGNDFIDGGIGSDFVFGGAGDDRIELASCVHENSNAINYGMGEDGNDTIEGANEGFNYLSGGNGNDVLSISNAAPGSATVFLGGAGNDIIRSASFTSYNGTPNPVVVGQSYLNGGTGNDTMYSRSDIPGITGSADHFVFSQGNDIVKAYDATQSGFGAGDVITIYSTAPVTNEGELVIANFNINMLNITHANGDTIIEYHGNTLTLDNYTGALTAAQFEVIV